MPAPLILPATTFSFLALLSPFPFLSHTTLWVSSTHLVHARDLLRYAMVRPHILAHPPFLWAPGTATEHSVRRTSSYLSPRGFGTALKPIYPRLASRTSLGGCAAKHMHPIGSFASSRGLPSRYVLVPRRRALGLEFSSALALPPGLSTFLGLYRSSHWGVCSSHHSGWTTGANLYAWPQSPTWPKAKQWTNDLLSHLTQQLIYGRSGPRFVAGDYNHSDDQLADLDLWRQAGWVEIQELAFNLWGRAPRPTFNGSTFIDKIFVSPGLWMTCGYESGDFQFHRCSRSRLSFRPFGRKSSMPQASTCALTKSSPNSAPRCAKHSATVWQVLNLRSALPCSAPIHYWTRACTVSGPPSQAALPALAVAGLHDAFLWPTTPRPLQRSSEPAGTP